VSVLRVIDANVPRSHYKGHSGAQRLDCANTKQQLGQPLVVMTGEDAGRRLKSQGPRRCLEPFIKYMKQHGREHDRFKACATPKNTVDLTVDF